MSAQRGNFTLRCSDDGHNDWLLARATPCHPADDVGQFVFELFHIAQGVGLDGAQVVLDVFQHIFDRFVVGGKAADFSKGLRKDFAALRVELNGDDEDAFVGEGGSLAEHIGRDDGAGMLVDEQFAGGDGFTDPGFLIVNGEGVTVFEREDAVAGLSEVGEELSHQLLVADFAMDRGNVERLGEPDHHLDLFLAGVTGDMDRGAVVGNDVGPEFGQAVDDPPDSAFVPGDGAGGVDDGVAARDFEPGVFATRHLAEGSHLFALAAGDKDGDFFLSVLVDVFDGEVDVVGHVEVAHLPAHLEGLVHPASGDGDFAPGFAGGIADLLHAVDLAGERGDENTAFGFGEDVDKAGLDVAFAGAPTGTLDIGRVGEEHEDAFFSEFGEAFDVAGFAVDRVLVELIVAAKEDDSVGRPDGERGVFGDRVCQPDGFDGEKSDVGFLAVLEGAYLEIDRLVAFVHAASDKGFGEGAGVDRNIDAFEEKGQAADVVFVGMGDDDGLDFMGVFFQIGEVGDDDIDAVMLFVREGDSAVDDDDFVVLFDDGAVFTDLCASAERNDFKERHAGVRIPVPGRLISG